MKLGKLAAILMIGAAETLAETPTHQILVSIPDRKLVLLEDGKVKKVSLLSGYGSGKSR